jgi:hypothetical protein
MSLADPMATVCHGVESAFSRPTWCTVQGLIVSTLRAHCRRTIAAALRWLACMMRPTSASTIMGSTAPTGRR